MKHTPGPWFTEREQTPSGCDLLVIDADYNLIADCRSADCAIEEEEERANAQLIASAPALLEACEKLLEEVQSYHIDWALLNSSSPDYDPKYKPKFPGCVEAAAKAIIKARRVES